MKHRSTQVSEPWLTDQKDPDNWLVIPEFGVNPVDVSFEGFRSPIVTPSSKKLREQHENIRTLVKYIRDKIRETFNSVSDVRAAHLRVLDVVWPADESIPKDQDLEALSREDKNATYYTLAMSFLADAVDTHYYPGFPKEPGAAALALSRFAMYLADWHDGDIGAISKHFEKQREELRSDVRKETASQGGRAKYKTHAAAKAFVQREWNKHLDVYQSNKSAFSRHYSRRVKKEFNVEVTERTIREVWLTNIPAASKQAR